MSSDIQLPDDDKTGTTPQEPDDDDQTAAMPPVIDNDDRTIDMPDLPSESPTAKQAAQHNDHTLKMPDTLDDAGRTAFMPPLDDADRTQPDQGSVKATDGDNKVLQSRYRLEKVLGQGGFGAAYLAEDVKLHRSCLVKQMILPPNVSLPDLELYRANFAREASLLVQLNQPGHPNIPEIFDYFSDESGNYLVMKYIEGPSLDAVVEQSDGRIPWREAVRYMTDICSALSYMHTQGNEPVMHRDIKPPNILLGTDGRAWLVDFGLAKAKPVKSTGDLMATQAAGTLGYTPLEQWLGEAVPASDVYAAGATLHYLVTGISPSSPFKGDLSVQKLKDFHGQFPSIRKTDKTLPKALDEVIARATSPEPESRLTALHFQQELEALISGAQAAALFTFKSGESAGNRQELVDLCEKYRSEAQEYLYHGDFERWFRMVNRNDLADAALQAVSQGKNEKDGLNKFLKLIAPNLIKRRMGRAGGKFLRVVVQLVLLLLIVALAAIVLGSFGAKSIAEETVGSFDWNFKHLKTNKENIITEEDVKKGADMLAGAYFDDMQFDMQPPDTVDVNVVWRGIPLNIPVTVEEEQGKPHLFLSEVNGIPLFLVATNLSAGINDGIDDAFKRSPVDISSLVVTDDAVVVNVEESTESGRPALPTSTPVPVPTATREGLALVTVFNETGQNIILQIEDTDYEMAVDDSKAIEVPPGTYDFTVIFADTGEVGAEGQKTWTVKTYKWRIN